MNELFDASAITIEELDKYRLITDTLADETVQKIINSGYEKQLNHVFRTLVTNDGYSNSVFVEFDPELRTILDHYFEVSAQMPIWADLSLIKKGEEVFSLYGPEIFMLLNVSSLPLCYTCAKGSQVLYDTGRLLTHNKDIDPLARRLMETAQMIVNVLSPGGLSSNGKGKVTVQKVRLIHASIRYFLKTKGFDGKPWNIQLGEPINQEDLTGTLMSFGPVIINGLKQLNINLSQEQSEAYMHTWKVVGYLMGIKEPLLPNTYEEGFDLATKILKHQAAESEAGKALTSSCITFLNDIMPGNIFKQLPAYFIDNFLSDFSKSTGINLSECLGIAPQEDKRNKIALVLSESVAGELSKLEHGKFVKKISEAFNKILLRSIIHHYNDGKSVRFSIPPSLQKNWGIDDWQDYRVSPSFGNNRIVWQKK